jgi:hypothetical protein
MASAPFVSSTHVSGAEDFYLEGRKPGPVLFFVSDAPVSRVKDLPRSRTISQPNK